MKVYSLVFVSILSLFASYSNAQQPYYTHVNSPQIKTLQVKVAGQMISDPFIMINDPNQIEINFDGLGNGSTNLSYSIIHCNADWTRSSLSPIEYLNGFQGNPIEDFANSLGTTTDYCNYKLLLPNSDVQLKVSGNYAVQIYNNSNPSNILFTACFSLVEPLVVVNASVTGNTDIDTNQSHQQVNFNLNTKDFPITYPLTDLKIFVYQDNRRDNAVNGLQPSSILENNISYSNIRNLIFPAGNEYRRMEFLGPKYIGMHVESIGFYNPYYNVQLLTDYIRANKPFQYDQDQDGRFFIRCNSCDDADTEADYYIVHFTLACDKFQNGKVYLNGELYNNVLNAESEMDYNASTNQYEKAVLLKQGSYNYQYLFVADDSTVGETGPIAGNFYQAENEYSIYVYYRPMGARYDRLIGVSSIKNTMPVF